ncbi:beta-galactosidase [Paenibacillus agricola]|uniref:beta-galactosidase n=1 Tax=Paenibacillus agricola TaxID=2716264 RepID=A0ABX0J573_9BACL|nr:alpha-amylase family protein [Paenibacillus agricola]NHN31475.1 cellulase family glycosylhydrolase [Paenibacillus agricola]
MSKMKLQVPYGAVYFRKSNPPAEDWERDYKVAKEDGMNIFRHWFMWGSIETSPGHYDWEDYDRQMDLAAENGIQTIIAEIIHSVPEWAVHRYANAIQINANGSKVTSSMGGSSTTGGYGGSGVLCLDCDEVKEAAGDFLKALATRYKDHPATRGYDVWNECNYSPTVCYCEHTKAKFRLWLESKYGTVSNLGKAWHRYSYTDWEQVQPPLQIAPYPECIDWLQFKRDNYYAQMQWRIDTIRSIDPVNLISAHGVASAIIGMASSGCDDWLAASKVELYGFTWVASRKGNQPWKQWHAVDLTRSASRGKPFWHAEFQGGPLWLQPQVIGREKEDGRITEPEDIRVWNMISFAGGAKGLLNPRWRPLLDGPLFGAFGAYGMDGNRTDRSNMASSVALWANEQAQEKLFQANPVQGDIGILVIPEVQQFDYLLNHEGKLTLYRDSMWGAYRGFFDNNIQADWVHIEDINKYKVLYFPYPIMFTSEQAEQLAKWVEQGGTMISEGCAGYFGDRGRVGTVQPNLGLHHVFGAIEEDVEFTPDIGDRISLQIDGLPLKGGGYLQTYRLAGGIERGRYDDGRLAAVEHHYGSGRTLLIGTFPSEGYYRHENEENRRFFADVFRWAGNEQHVVTSNTALQVRIHEGDEDKFVWIINPTREIQEAHLQFASSYGQVALGDALWAAAEASTDGLRVTVPARDALIFRLQC